MANTDEPRREMPGDLYPEWTTRPHSVQGRGSALREPPVAGRDVRPRAPLRSRAWLLALVVLGVVAALFFVGRERMRLRRAPLDNSAVYAPDTQLEEAARARLAREPDLADQDVTLVVREQVVTVSGRVRDDKTREKVLNIVRMTPNVTGVIDHLGLGEPNEKRK